MLTLRALRTCASSSRSFATSSRARDAFSDLAAITSSSTPSPAASSTSAFSVAAPAAPRAPVRGYEPGVIAPKGDPVLELLTNHLMKHGEKAKAQKHVSIILTELQRATNKPPLPLLQQALELAAPSVRITTTRKGAKVTLVPKALNERQRTSTAIKLILKAARKGRRAGSSQDEKIVREIVAVLDGQSEVFRRIEEVHKIAVLNRSNLRK